MATPSSLPRDLDPDLSLATSPSKALLHQRTTAAWSQIHSWLSTLAPTLPPATLQSIERNPATLTYLQDLLDANTRADHRRRVLHDSQAAQLKVYAEHDEAVRGSPEQQLLNDLNSALPASSRAQLQEIARASISLGHLPSAPSFSDFPAENDDLTTTLSKKLIDLTKQLFHLQSELSDLSALTQRFEDERRTIDERISKLREPAASIDDADLDIPTHTTNVSTAVSRSAKPSLGALLAQTSNLSSSTKHLTLKIKEYQDRIAALTRTFDSQTQNEMVTLEDVQYKEEVVQKRKEEVEKLEARLKEFQGLPPDVEASREEVRRAKGELEEWKRRRERMFEDIGSG